MGVLVVTSLLPGEGRTAFSSGLAHLLRDRGHRPALFKPVRIYDSSLPSQPDADAAFFAHLLDAPSPAGWPLDIEAQEAAIGLPRPVLERIKATFQQVAGAATETIVEGPPMALGQGRALAITPELAEALDARVVLLARYSPHLPYEHILDAARALGSRMAGVVVNRVLRYRGHETQKDLIEPLQSQGIPVLAVLPEERCLLGVTVGQLAHHLGGEFLAWEEKRDQMVDHLMIGGLVLDWGVQYFGQSETKAVIVRGDRPDIQMAALHTPTRCLVLTGGQRPIEYVEYEAREEEVPVLLVQSDTLTTTRALESLFANVTVHHPQKAECFARLLAGAPNLKALVPTGEAQ